MTSFETYHATAASLRQTGLDPNSASAGKAQTVSFAADGGKAAPASDQKLSFWDFLDVVNPLQHIPVLNSFYRSVTGDAIGEPARIMGGTLFGGPIGMVSGIFQSVMKETTGKDLAETVVAMVNGEETGQDASGGDVQFASAGSDDDATLIGDDGDDRFDADALLARSIEGFDHASASGENIAAAAAGLTAREAKIAGQVHPMLRGEIDAILAAARGPSAPWWVQASASAATSATGLAGAAPVELTAKASASAVAAPEGVPESLRSGLETAPDTTGAVAGSTGTAMLETPLVPDNAVALSDGQSAALDRFVKAMGGATPETAVPAPSLQATPVPAVSETAQVAATPAAAVAASAATSDASSRLMPLSDVRRVPNGAQPLRSATYGIEQKIRALNPVRAADTVDAIQAQAELHQATGAAQEQALGIAERALAAQGLAIPQAQSGKAVAAPTPVAGQATAFAQPASLRRVDPAVARAAQAADTGRQIQESFTDPRGQTQSLDHFQQLMLKGLEKYRAVDSLTLGTGASARASSEATLKP